ncbi:thioesterase family protein [Gemelliphila palaticanis]|uniref:Thioesterase family protein n=1 Tax=Gemelliphila palaticanis TaxID=81950 RepID=A0ABX2T2C6_9BACL|nr:thioesterase family protein [Gemella palaticanis]MBF0715241.1 thioesterase family protein [Gemella palaticanis]NYS47171.1 thioesterase family protein [Gemella palaticanis]
MEILNKELEKSFIVKNNHSAIELGSGDLEVLSTPMLVAYMEETSRDLINKYISSEFTSVGSNININHLKPTKLGYSVKIISKINNIIKDKIVVFLIEAYEISEEGNSSKIGDAEHTRVIVNREKFLIKLS